MGDGVEWGNGAQVTSAIVAALAFCMSIFAIFRQHNDAAIKDVKASVSKLSDSVDKQFTELRKDDSRGFERIDKLEADLAGVKADVRHLPTADDVHAIDLKLAQQGEMLRSLTEAVANIAGTAKMIERSLLEREIRDEGR